MDIKLYHIVHIDNLSSIIADGFLYSDSIMENKSVKKIGMTNIKNRRLRELHLPSYPDLFVGNCVPFYFCPRSIMLYIIYKRNDELTYKEGQECIMHLKADFYKTIEWAKYNNLRWVYTLSNAGSYHFIDKKELSDLNQINWDAVKSDDWRNPQIKEAKQAEFLIEDRFPFELVEKIGVYSDIQKTIVQNILKSNKPFVETERGWYY
jgi:hypothetical protein